MTDSELMKETGMTLKALSQLLGVSYSHLRKVSIGLYDLREDQRNGLTRIIAEKDRVRELFIKE